MFFLLSTLLPLLATVTCTQSHTTDSAVTEDISDLEKVYLSYDKNTRPPGANPTEVDVDIYIISLSAVSEMSMDFTVNMYMRQRWKDTRLANLSRPTDLEPLLITHKQKDTWMPDIFIKNDKVSKMSDVTTLNTFLRLDPEGNLLYSLRVTSTIACSMELSRYPFDVQNCEVLFESYGHLTSEVRFKWKKELPVERDDHIELPEHVLAGANPGNCTKTYDSTGSYSCISLIFVFRRNINYYIMGLFVPTILIVVLSWVAFWIDKSSTPGRVSLSLLTILTMQNQMSSTLAQLPKVSYIKLVDVWLTGCLTFVFAGFLEYALVNKLTIKARERQSGLPASKVGLSDKFLRTGALDEKTIMLDEAMNRKSDHPPVKSHKKKKEMSLADKVDYYSRFLFPFTFFIFNLILWSCYLTTDDLARL